MEWRRCRAGAESTDLDAGGGGEMELSSDRVRGWGGREDRRPTPGLGLTPGGRWCLLRWGRMKAEEGKSGVIWEHGERATALPEDTPSLRRR